MQITAIYCRVSGNGQRFDSQESDLKKWIELKKPDKVHWFRDKFTGKTMNRVGMQKLMDSLHRGELDSIVVWRLDRLGRTASGLTRLFDELRQYGCNLISLKENLNLGTPSGRFTANILASVASFENEIRSERIRAGQTAAMAKGKKWGGSPKGIRKKKTAGKIKSVLKLLEAGVRISEISRAVGLTPPTIYSIIKADKADPQKTKGI